jgi:hypothetical protein
MIRKLSLVTGLLLAAVAPFTARAEVGVSVAVSTPQFGIRIGAPVYGPRVYAPAAVYVPPPVISPVVYSPAAVVVAPAQFVISSPRVAYPARFYVPPPRVVYVSAPRFAVPHGHPPHPRAYPGQHAGYRVLPGPGRRASVRGSDR